MNRQIINTKFGYVVCIMMIDNNSHYNWHPLINFGDRQSDAIEFKEDLNHLSQSSIYSMMAGFNVKKRYSRIGLGNYITQNTK